MNMRVRNKHAAEIQTAPERGGERIEPVRK